MQQQIGQQFVENSATSSSENQKWHMKAQTIEPDELNHNSHKW